MMPSSVLATSSFADQTQGPLHPVLGGAMPELERHERLALADAVVVALAQSCADCLDHVLEIAWLGVIVHRELDLVALIAADQAVAQPTIGGDRRRHGDHEEAQPGNQREIRQGRRV